MDRLRKSFAIFDCDAHISDPAQIWRDYVPVSKKDLVRETYWPIDRQDDVPEAPGQAGGGASDSFDPRTIAGPGMTKAVQRKLRTMSLTSEQVDYLDHKGAYNAHARVRDLDVMGIDQVLVIPTHMIAFLPYAESTEGVVTFCDAYNNWLRDWCAEAPGRLFGASMLPLHDLDATVATIERSAERGFPVGLIRPIDALGNYPNNIGLRQHPISSITGVGEVATFDAVYKTFEETGVCLGMHTFPAGSPGRTGGPGQLSSPGEFSAWTGTDSQALSFIYEAQTWLGQVLLSGFLDRYPRLKMLIFESNSQWVPAMLAHCDRLFKLYRNERNYPARRLPSEAFHDQCMVGFESDEEPTFHQWRDFEEIAIWSSDCYHHDGSDAWSALRRMIRIGVPEQAQIKMMGGNARRFYGIEEKLFVTEEPPPIQRPDWFPQGPEFEEWIHEVADPRKYGLVGSAASRYDIGQQGGGAATVPKY